MTIKEEIISSILKELHIYNERYIYIKSYITRMVKDYKGQPIDIIKEISLNLKGNERYFSIFLVGNFFSPLFLQMGTKQNADFVLKIADGIKLSDESLELTGEYISHDLRRQKKENMSVAEMIKRIINSNFTDIEKDYLIFIFGMTLV